MESRFEFMYKKDCHNPDLCSSVGALCVCIEKINPEIVQICENLLSGGFTLMNTRQGKSKEDIVEGLGNLIQGILLSNKKSLRGL